MLFVKLADIKSEKNFYGNKLFGVSYKVVGYGVNGKQIFFQILGSMNLTSSSEYCCTLSLPQAGTLIGTLVEYIRGRFAPVGRTRGSLSSTSVSRTISIRPVKQNISA